MIADKLKKNFTTYVYQKFIQKNFLRGTKKIYNLIIIPFKLIKTLLCSYFY